MTSRLAVSTSSTSTAARRPVSSSSTGAKPTARAQRPIGLPLPDSSTMTERAVTVVADPHDRGERAERRPGGDRLTRAAAGRGRARWPRRRRPSSSTASTSVARTRSGMSVGAELDDRPTAGADAGHGRPGARHRAERDDRAASSARRRRGAAAQRLDAADVVGPRAGQVGRAHLGAQPRRPRRARRAGAARATRASRSSGGTSSPSTSSRTCSGKVPTARREHRAPRGGGRAARSARRSPMR